MSRIYETLDDDSIAWIERQHLFFVGTAPGNGGHVNCSPKGLAGLRILGPRTVTYLDFTGSGVETIAHLRDNGRIVLMFCAFEGPPKIVRIYGRGTVVQAGDPRFDGLLSDFLPLDAPMLASARSVICVDVDRIADSCGYGVPLMSYDGERSQSQAWASNRLRKRGPGGIVEYQRDRNLSSIDGLPGLDPALQAHAGQD